MPIVSIGAGTLPILSQQGSNIFGQNIGSKVIYLSSDISTGTGNGLRIDPLGTFDWPGNEPLYVSGSGGLLSYDNNGAHATTGTVNSNIIGTVTVAGALTITGPVTVTGTVAISNGTLNVTGTVAISSGTINALITGPVTVTSGSISINNALRTATLPTLLYTQFMNVPTGAGSYNFTAIPLQSMVGYSSAIITLSYSAGVVLAGALTNYITTTCTMQTGAIVDYYTPQWMLASAGNTKNLLQIPVTGSDLFFDGTVVKAGTAAVGTLRIDIYGSNEDIASPRYLSAGNGLAGLIPETGLWALSLPAATTQAQLVANRNGTVYLGQGATGGAGAPNTYINAVVNGTPKRLGVMATAQNENKVLQLPLAPLYITTVTIAASPADFTAVQ